jgi:hypothetical protein
VEYINYTRNLEFEQEPNYEYTRGLFRNVMTKYNYQYDYQYDWVKPQKKEDSSIKGISMSHNKNIRNSLNQNNFINTNNNLSPNNMNNINHPLNTNMNMNTNTNINNNININLNTISILFKILIHWEN